MRTRLIKTDGLVQQVLEAGYDQPNAPLVLLIHGFPELGISWRAQVEALSLAGYHVAAPDMRGYGGTDKPQGAAETTACGPIRSGDGGRRFPMRMRSGRGCWI